MNWLVNARWFVAVAAAACALLAVYVADVRGDGSVAGVLGFVALLLAWQWFRIGNWIRRLQRAKRDSE